MDQHRGEVVGIVPRVATDDDLAGGLLMRQALGGRGSTRLLKNSCSNAAKYSPWAKAMTGTFPPSQTRSRSLTAKALHNWMCISSRQEV